MENLGRKFAAMTDEERRRLARERGRPVGGAAGERAADEVEINDPNEEDQAGRQFPIVRTETADPDSRDGEAALLDDAAHRRTLDLGRGRDAE